MRSFRSMRHQAGLGLLEVLLAITVSLVVGAIAADQLRSHNETQQATAAGDQLKLVGNALNTYVAQRYNNIVSFTNVGGSCPNVNNTTDSSMAGTAADPGPRCCDPASGFCSITSDTLRRNGLLPNSFSGYNAYGAQYQYLIRVQGGSPSYIVDGMAFTSVPYTTTGTTPRYDLLGVAMQEAGADSGMTRSVVNRMEGLNGAWNDSNYPTSGSWAGYDQLGLLGFRVGYGTSGYAAYLRLDGSTAMTGNLNMGGNGISNVSQLLLNGPTASGAAVVQIASSSTSGASGSAITDTGTNGGLTLRNANGVTVTTLAGTARAPVAASAGNFGSSSTLNNTSITANGLTGVLNAPTINAGYINSQGTSQVYNGTGNINARSGNVMIQNGYGVVFDPNGTGTAVGGWYMNDTTWVRSVNGLGVLTSGEMRGTNVTALDNVYVGNISGATVGASCSYLTTTGSGNAIPMTKSSATNEILQCRNGFWSPLGTTTTVQSAAGTSSSNASYSVATCPTNSTLTGGGYALVTYVPGSTSVGANSPDQSFPSGNTWQVLGSTVSASVFRAYAVCAL
jgi:hypothetical protein